MVHLFKRVSIMIACLLVVTIGIAFGAQDIPALKEAKTSAERARLKALIDGARKEGKLVWLGNMIETKHGKVIIADFKKYYGLPDFKYEYTYASSGKTVSRVETLLKAGRTTADVMYFGGHWAWDHSLIERGIIMPYDSPNFKAYTNSHKAKLTNPGYWVADAYSFHPVYNPTKLAKAGVKDFNPTSYWDFTDPKLKGLISMCNIYVGSSCQHVALGLEKALGEKWFKAMAKQDLALHQRSSQGRQWLVSGEYPIATFSHAKNASIARKAGADVKVVYPKEGITLLPFYPVIMKTGKHHNAAKLFVDYVRSARGAQMVADAGALILFGRPGIKSSDPDLLPAWEDINFIPLDLKTELTETKLKKVGQLCVDVGICR